MPTSRRSPFASVEGLALAAAVSLCLGAGCDRGTRAAAVAGGDQPPGVARAAGQPDVVDARSLRALLGDLHGKVAVVNVWASWCAPCVAELPELDAFARDARGRGVEVVALSVDDLPSRATAVRALLATLKPSFRVVQRGPGSEDPVRAVLDGRWEGQLPTTFVLDRSGVLRVTLIGAQRRASLEAATAPLLGEASAGGPPPAAVTAR